MEIRKKAVLRERKILIKIIMMIFVFIIFS